MEWHPIEVECEAGGAADAIPRAFTERGRRSEIAEIRDRWYQGCRDPEWPVADYFKVCTAAGASVLLAHDREADAWFRLIGGGESA